MRSRLLISVALLPTISETSEMMMLGGTQAKDELKSDLLSSQSLDDYVKSICQLAQPTSVLDGAHRLPCNRPRKPCRLRGKTFNDVAAASHSEMSSPNSSLQDITACFSGQQPALTLGNNIDPLDWLFGESQPKRQSRKDSLRRTGLSTDPSSLHKQSEMGKSRVTRRVRAYEAKVPGSPLTKLSSEWSKAWERITQPSTVNTALEYSSSPHQGRRPRSLNSYLPIIYEL
ncbi:protein DEPP1 [Dromiciops gliroides]|uniref:protein DEPP1 n=1 Tax=Dromiciops gliroides TaxID=33562 RepID=UPI001CC5D167|nr:protein DEPP1 [Dromiciops gliroides]